MGDTSSMWILTGALASPWVPEPGQARVSVGYSQLVTETQWASPEVAGRVGPRCPAGVRAGTRAPFDCTTGGRFTNRTASADVAVGLPKGLALDLYVPVVLHASFADDIGRTDARGLGDLRFGLRASRVQGPVAVAGVLQVKAPTGPAGLVDRDVPLGDAQWDVIPGVRVGVSLHRWGWVELHNHLAIRLKSTRSGTDPGEEWGGSLGGGVRPLKWGGWLARAEWILAGKDEDAFGLSHPGRSLLQLRTGPFVNAGPVWVELGAAVPVAGRRWPGAPAFGAAVAWTSE